MLSELQKRKFTRLFKLYDLDKDGVLQQADFEQFAANVARVGNPNAPADCQEQLRAMYIKQWQQVQQAADVDRNNTVSLAEWLQHHDALVNTPGMIQAIPINMLNGFYALWEVVDPGVGRLTTERRYQMFFAGFNEDPAAAAATFKLLDLDGDGVLSEAEVTQRIVEYFGDDPNAAGNWLVGEF